MSGGVGLVVVPRHADLRPRPAASAAARPRAAHLGPDRGAAAWTGSRTCRSSAPSPPRSTISSACTRDAFIDATTPRGARRGRRLGRVRVRSGRQPDLRGHARGGRARLRRLDRRRSGGLARRGGARVQRVGRAAPRDAGARERVLRVRRSRRRDRVAAGRRRRARRLRRRRRPPRRRVRRRSSGTTRGCSPISLHEYEPPFFFPGTGACRSAAGRTRRGARSTCRCPAAPVTARGSTRSETIVPRAVAEFASRRARDPARLRHASHRSAGASCGSRPRAYREAARGAARARARRGRRTVGRHRRRRLPLGARRAARVDAVRSPRWRGPPTDLPDELPADWVERARRRAPASRCPTTFSEPALAPHAADDEAATGRGGGRRHTVGLMARTKLVCTLGPASATPKMVQGLVRAGASVFRLNFSHGTPEEHARMVELVREAEEAIGQAARRAGRPAGSEGAARLGAPGPVHVSSPGQRFELRPDGDGDERGASTTYPGLANDLTVGDRVLLADGAVELTVDGDRRRRRQDRSASQGVWCEAARG